MGRDSQYLGVYYCHTAESGPVAGRVLRHAACHAWGSVQVDAGTFQAGAQPESPNGGGVTQIWVPPPAPLSAVVDFISLDVYEVRVMQQMGGPKLRSAIELVSPANKDRASHRRAFAITCAGYLQQGVAVVIVDVVTGRTANLHAALVSLD